MVCHLKNEVLNVIIKPEGAELTSIKDKAGHEYLWQADPSVWSRHAPVLFPIVGALKNGSYCYEGTEYSLSQHGFARDSLFTVIRASDLEAEFQLKSDARTLTNYPFEFDFRVIYRLEGSQLMTRFEVYNLGDRDMLFSVGGHPAFNLNWLTGDSIDDYYLEFDQSETLNVWQLEDSLLAENPKPFLDQERIIQLSSSTFDHDALIFLEHNSGIVSLCHKRTSRRISVNISGFPHLGIWSKPGAPYVCIEPWQGHVDPTDHSGQFEDKPGIVRLCKGGHYSAEFSVTIT
ncbi:aldose 1-epimerase family protein [Litoribacillus peritrichatus]|uniref:Aldose 1-epimerase family protein n=1 Tax=Litoribacillus peritrichatus TaxID=718191 RepID=A0ABP7MA43_9GAMM